MSELRAELRNLVDVLPMRKIKQARSYDTILLRVTDTDLSDEDRSDIVSAQSDASAGRSIPWEDAKKELGL